MSPNRPLLSILSCALIALCFFSACSSKHNSVITEQQVSTFLNEMDNAARNKDVDGVVSRMSQDVQLKVTIEGFGPTQTVSLNRDQYRDYSNQSLSVTGDYDYRRGETVIKIEPDGQSAFVADETFETTTVRGQVIRTVSRGTSTLKLENGKLVISRSEATLRPLKTGEKPQPAGF